MRTATYSSAPTASASPSGSPTAPTWRSASSGSSIVIFLALFPFFAGTPLDPPPGGLLHPAGSGPVLEPDARLRRPHLGGAAGLHRHRLLHAVAVRRRLPHQPVHQRDLRRHRRGHHRSARRLLVFKLKGGYLAIGTWVIAEILRLDSRQHQADRAVARASPSRRPPSWAPACACRAATGGHWARRSSPWPSPTSCCGRAPVWPSRPCGTTTWRRRARGVNLWRTKLYTYIIAGAGCALVGAIVAIHLLRVQPAAAFSHQLDRRT